MEKETSFFNIEKNDKSGGMSNRAPSVMSFMGQAHHKTQNRRGSSQLRSAMSRTSSLSKSNNNQRVTSQSRDSHISKGSGKHDFASSSDGNSVCKSGKDFFNLMKEYFEEVDQVLRQSTCTYHHIVKNSIKTQVELNE